MLLDAIQNIAETEICFERNSTTWFRERCLGGTTCSAGYWHGGLLRLGADCTNPVNAHPDNLFWQFYRIYITRWKSTVKECAFVCYSVACRHRHCVFRPIAAAWAALYP